MARSFFDQAGAGRIASSSRTLVKVTAPRLNRRFASHRPGYANGGRAPFTLRE
jgi:hypothetical protein